MDLPISNEAIAKWSYSSPSSFNNARKFLLPPTSFWSTNTIGNVGQPVHIFTLPIAYPQSFSMPSGAT